MRGAAPFVVPGAGRSARAPHAQEVHRRLTQTVPAQPPTAHPSVTTTKGTTLMKRTTTATTLGAAALIALTGCGGSDVSEGDTVPLTDLQKDVDAGMKDAGTGSMTAKAGKEKLEGDFDLSEKKPSATLQGKTGQDSLDVRLVEGTYYLKAPSPQMTQKGKSWIKVPAETKDPTEQQLASSLEAMTKLSDPVAAIDGAKDVKAKVTEASDDEVTYEIKLSKKQMGKALEAQAKKSGDPQAEAMAAQASQGAQATTVKLAVDDKDRPVKSVTSAGDQKLTISYKGWGDDVKIDAPEKKSVGTIEVPKQAQAPSGQAPSGQAPSGGAPSGS